MTDIAVETLGLSRSFETVEAVHDLNLVIRRGEMFTLVGPDGAGKSTLLRMLCGILKPTKGSARVLGLDLVRETARLKSRIGYFSQRFSLYGDLSVDENIEFFAEIHQVPDFRARRERLLEFTRLAPFRTRLAEQLSGGMKQKLALACTLVHTPEIIFLDEPTTGVDPVSRRDFWTILADLLKDGVTIVMTTPYLDEAERSSRVGLLNQGRLMAADTPQNIKSRMPGTVIEVVCREIRRAREVLQRLPGPREIQMFGDRLNVVLPESGDAPARAFAEQAQPELRTAGVAILDWRVIPPSLENVFVSLLKSA